MSKYEVVNEKGKTVMVTEYAPSLFDIKVVNSMLKAGYKIKKDDKLMTKKDIVEILKTI